MQGSQSIDSIEIDARVVGSSGVGKVGGGTYTLCRALLGPLGVTVAMGARCW